MPLSSFLIALSPSAGSLIARREKGYRVVDLIGIGSLALILIAAGLGVMMWSGFSIRVFDIAIGSGGRWYSFRVAPIR